MPSWNLARPTPLLRSFVLAVGVALSGCTVHSLDGAVFACQQDSDCSSDEVCLEHICRSQESLADGGPIIGHCAQDCSADHKMCCGTACVDLASDDHNCGTCGTICQSGQTCVAGKCARETSCENGRDDNGDGLTDCEDDVSCPATTACAGGGHCCEKKCALEATDELCSNGRDDDCNGKNDCDDEGCLGRRCAQGSVCTGPGTCAAGCFIDGQFRPEGSPKPNSPCFVCSARQDPHDWTPLPAGSMPDGCKSTRACNAAGQCRRATGQSCGSNGDCATKTCATGICL